MARAFGLFALVCAVLGALAAPAQAHGIRSQVAGKSAIEFVPIGIEHMLLGWDHLLFIIAVVLLAGTLRRATKMLSVFVAGHSTTLIAATMAGWRVDDQWVDVVIALSVVYVGVVGIFGGPRTTRRWRWFGAGVLAFGLIHGLGLATRLQELGMPEDGLLPRVIAFNVGIEIGQVLAITAVVGLGRLAYVALRRPRAARRPGVVRGANVALSVVGAIAATFLARGAVAGVDPYEEMLATTSMVCEVKRDDVPVAAAEARPGKVFFAPGEALPAGGFAAFVGGGGISIRYDPALPKGEWEQLESFVSYVDDTVAAPAQGKGPTVVAATRNRTLECTAVDIEALSAFRELWSDERAARPS